MISRLALRARRALVDAAPFLAGLCLCMAVASALVLKLSSSWSLFFRIILLVHPVAGLAGAALLLRALSRELRATVPTAGIGLSAVVVAAIFFTFFRGFTSTYLPEVSANRFGGLAAAALVLSVPYLVVRLRLSARDPRTHAPLAAGLARLGLVGVAVASGATFAAAGGGRELLVLLSFHQASAVLAVLAVVLPRLLREAPRRRALSHAAGATLALAGMAVTACSLWRPPGPDARPAAVTLHLSTIPYENREPADQDRLPLPLDVRWLDVSEGCAGGRGCHRELYEDFAASVHDVSFSSHHLQKNLALLADEIGARNQALCAGCHTPLALLEGAPPVAAYARRHGTSCVVCHIVSAARIEDRRRSSLTLEPPYAHLSMFLGPGQRLGRMDLLLIRLNPRAHGRAFTRPLHGRDDLCVACHHLQLRPSGKGVSCVRCHMERRDTIGLTGGAKNHFFPGTNVSLPALAGHPAYARLNERWMQGSLLATTLSNLYGTNVEQRLLTAQESERASTFLALRPELAGPAQCGQPVQLRVATENTGIDHAFPSSSLDLAEVWLEVRATDETGRLRFASGGVDAEGRMLPANRRMGGHMIGLDDQPVTRNRVWQVKEKVVDREIAGGATALDSFEFPLSPPCGRFLNVTAEWHYRKLGHDFWRWAYGPDTPIPDVVNARAFRQFVVDPGLAPRPASDPAESATSAASP